MYHWEKTSLNPKRFKFDLKLRSHEYQEYSEAKWISPVLFLEIHRETAENFSRTLSIFLKLVTILQGSIQIRNVIAFFLSFSHHLLLTHLSILFSWIKIGLSIKSHHKQRFHFISSFLGSITIIIKQKSKFCANKNSHLQEKLWPDFLIILFVVAMSVQVKRTGDWFICRCL